MAYTDINSEDRLQETFADYLRDALGWDCVYAWNQETFGPDGTLGRTDTRDVVLKRELRAAVARLNPELPEKAIAEAVDKLTRHDFSRSLIQHNQAFYKMIRGGVPVSYRDAKGTLRETKARVIDFRDPLSGNNRFLAVRELKITGLRTPGYNRRADLVCFVNGLPLVFFELKAVYVNIRAGFDGNLRDYLDEHVIAHAFHHNAFLIVSNGHRARYGSITSQWEHFAEWKRQDESDKGSVDAKVLLNGLLDKARLLDIVENFILFDASKPGAVRKIVARNHQVLGVNRALASVIHQEELKKQFPAEERLKFRLIELEPEPTGDADKSTSKRSGKRRMLKLPEPIHPDLGKLGVVWHTQGSGKSYSMAFFTEKVQRKVPGSFTFVLMTDREDLDSQIYRTFVGCGLADDQTPRANSGKVLEQLLKQNHCYIFSLIHKFNQDVKPGQPYSLRDDIIVISDEAHRTQAGKLARNMRMALPNAAFVGFTGTPLFTHDHLTRRIFGDYVSRYDFKRSEEDKSTAKLVYESRGEKLGIARTDLNKRMAEVIEQAELDPDQEARLEKLIGKDYEVITADNRLDKIADDFVKHCATRWQSGKSMLVCIDKVTCARMYQRIIPRWQTRLADARAEIDAKKTAMALAQDDETRQQLQAQYDRLREQAKWMDETLIAIIISEAQNEVADFKEWDFDIVPHRARIKQGFETPDGKRVDVETAFKDPEHPFRTAIVCAMWLTGFDVECLFTLYLDKPMKAHTLMQAIARANRCYPGKDFGLIVDYNGMLKSLREALAQYALGQDSKGGEEEIVAPIEERVKALLDAMEATEAHLQRLGFDTRRLIGAKGFTRIEALADAVEAIYSAGKNDADKNEVGENKDSGPDEAKRRFEILARQVFNRFKALLMEPAVFQYAERHDNIEAIYKKLGERRDNADVTALVKQLQRIVNEAIQTQQPATAEPEAPYYDLSQINLEQLRDEFSKKVKRKATALKDIQDLIEAKLARMLALNPRRMDYDKKYREIIAEYNRDKDQLSIEETFTKLVDYMKSLDEEQLRAASEKLTEEELALFDFLKKPNLSQAVRDRVKLSSKKLLASLQEFLPALDRWTEKEQTQAEVKVFIRDHIYRELPSPSFSEQDKDELAETVFGFVWQQSLDGMFGAFSADTEFPSA
jgi:type I restriction enzyme R subunit